MENDIFSHAEMCRREGVTNMQQGMNFDLGAGYSVILMSRLPNATYQDVLEENGDILIYEGHDVPRSLTNPNPKLTNQSTILPNGQLTQNGKFYMAAENFKSKKRAAERVRVYEKLESGLWQYRGVFLLIDSWLQNDGKRTIFKFKLQFSRH